ncbi:MAG TPA: hypothetical protein VL093_06325 [Flavipsychrobacter sp.]|nr:hypothetical protein [Flavipsychrobacter sp.]
MKFLLSLVSFFLFTNAFSQTRDLISLAQGNFLGMNALFNENGDLFGYISIYDYGKSGEKTKKFEYVVLDKNLNPFANKTFDGDITAGNYWGYINFDGKIILSPNALDMSMIKRKEVFAPSPMEIDLKDNSIHKKLYYDYEHGNFKEIVEQHSWKENQKEYKAEKKHNGFNYISEVVEIKEGGLLVLEYDDYGSYAKNNRLLRFDDNKKELWRYEYNEQGSKSQYQKLRFIEKDEKHFYGILEDKDKANPTKYYLLVIDMKTGKVLHKKEIEGAHDILSHITSFQTFSYGTLSNAKTFDDKIVIVGREGSYPYYTGIARLVIDKETFNTGLKVLSYKSDFKTFIPKISEYGYVEKSFLLDPRDIFFLKDGSIGLLLEKYKEAGEYNAQKTTDLVYVYTDKDFKIAGVKVLKKEKSKWQNSDYLFSQYLNDGNDLVFFYRDFQKDDETKDKNWNLFINTFIKGTFKQETIPISSKENFLIFPYIAKEGYILLQEFNKKAKYNQIRLERLNY